MQLKQHADADALSLRYRYIPLLNIEERTDEVVRETTRSRNPN